MDYEKFNKICYESLRDLSDYASTWDDRDGFSIQYDKIIQKHITGGAEGGNCWGDEAKQFTNTKAPQGFIPLDRILTAVKPEISFLKYKEIEELIVVDSGSEYEYYGNHTNYDTYTLDIEKLYDTLFPKEG